VKQPPRPLVRTFDPPDFRCRCGDCAAHKRVVPALRLVHERALLIWDELERQLRRGVRLQVNSAVRCDRYNTAVGGAKNSYHLRGMALDLTPTAGCSVAQLFEAARVVRGDASPEHPQRTGAIGHYKTFIHQDVRDGYATKLDPGSDWRRGRGERG